MSSTTTDPTLPATPSSEGPREIVIGSRKSQLALVQTHAVLAALQKLYPTQPFRIHAISTAGDKNLNQALHSFAAKSLWTKELEELMLDGKVDLIVHSLKDMPTVLPEGCVLGAVMEREDPRDAVVMKAGSQYTRLEDLPEGSTVGTSSVRRSAQVARQFPKLKFADVRGNIGTRLSKLDDPQSSYSCLILAAAGLVRLNLTNRISSYLSSPVVLHAVGQGALGIETRTADPLIGEMVSKLIHERTYLAALAERQLMRTLEGGCSVPIGVETDWSETEKHKLVMKGRVASVDGTEMVETEEEAVVDGEKGAEELGRKVAGRLVELGAERILKVINENREVPK